MAGHTFFPFRSDIASFDPLETTLPLDLSTHDDDEPLLLISENWTITLGDWLGPVMAAGK